MGTKAEYQWGQTWFLRSWSRLWMRFGLDMTWQPSYVMYVSCFKVFLLCLRLYFTVCQTSVPPCQLWCFSSQALPWHLVGKCRSSKVRSRPNDSFTLNLNMFSSDFHRLSLLYTLLNQAQTLQATNRMKWAKVKGEYPDGICKRTFLQNYNCSG